MKKYCLKIMCSIAVFALMMSVSGCFKQETPVIKVTEPVEEVEVVEEKAPEESAGVSEPDKRTAKVVQTGSGVSVISASDWSTQHPDVYASYMKNSENDEHHSYVEKYPMISVLYEGMAFNEFYNSARGHVYTIQDVESIGRPHPLANCFTCKTPNFTAAVNELGDEAYKIPFEEMLQKIEEPISCYNCHANEPGDLVVTHTYLSDAMGSDLESVNPETLSCAQCHVEYYFDPESKAVTLPYDGLGTMNPDSILSYFNNMDVEGKSFSDYTNPRSGVRQIKVQHPEFETYMGEGSVHASTYSCADCHMGDAVNASGETYKNHKWSSPLDNKDLIDNTCSTCHNDLAADVSKIQELAQGRTKEVGEALQQLTEDLVAAAESGRYTEEELDEIRNVYRDAQFYWDFVFVENSNGAHNSKLTNQCLDKSEAILNEVREML